MSVYSIYFSPTGGTKRVMELLCSGWQETPQVIDLCDSGRNFSELSLTCADVCLIGVPSFGGRVPETALKRLAQIKGGGAAAVLVTAYGNRAYEDTLLELQDTALSCGFRIAGAAAAVTEHSIMRQYGAGRPDAEDETRLRDFSRQLRQAVENMPGAGNKLTLPGGRPFRDYNGVPFKPKAGKSCTECGACAGLCPVDAIPKNDPRKTDTSRCISCMRCISVCPVHARSLNKAMLFAAGQSMKKAFEGRKTNDIFLG